MSEGLSASVWSGTLGDSPSPWCWPEGSISVSSSMLVGTHQQTSSWTSQRGGGAGVQVGVCGVDEGPQAPEGTHECGVGCLWDERVSAGCLQRAPRWPRGPVGWVRGMGSGPWRGERGATGMWGAHTLRGWFTPLCGITGMGACGGQGHRGKSEVVFLQGGNGAVLGGWGLFSRGPWHPLGRGRGKG